MPSRPPPRPGERPLGAGARPVRRAGRGHARAGRPGTERGLRRPGALTRPRSCCPGVAEPAAGPAGGDHGHPAAAPAAGPAARPSGPRPRRLAVPVPPPDASWVGEGWPASRYEPDTVSTRDLDVTLAAGRVLHAELAAWVSARPAGLDARTARWAVAEREAFADGEVDLPSQLVHADLFGNVLLDGRGAPVVIDVSPAWRPARWAEAVAVLDAVADAVAPPSVLAAWSSATDRELLRRALTFRVASDPEPERYRWLV